MKKTLFITSALVGAGMLAAAPAAAAEKIKLGLGGFMEQWAGFADQDDTWAGTRDYGSFDIKSDTEVFFTGSTKLDNGLTISATVELEADRSSGGTIDDSFIEISSGTLGTLQLGAAGDAVNGIAVYAPDVGIGNTDGDVGTWIVKPTANFIDNSVTFTDLGNGNKVNYISPTFGGLSVVATFMPDGSNNDQNQPNYATGGVGMAYGVGAAYSRQIEGVGLSMDVGYSVTENAAALLGELEVYHAGINLTYAGFTFGGSYGNFQQEDDLGFNSTALQDGYAFDVGLAYATGPYSLSLSYFGQELEGNSATAGEEKTSSVMLSGAYNMGPGVDIKGSVFRAEYEDEVTTATQNNEGWGAVAGMAIEF